MVQSSASSSLLSLMDGRHTFAFHYTRKCSDHTVDTSDSGRNWHPAS